MKNILIIAYECAPYNRPGSTIGAQRPYQFAKYLPQNGWRSIVLCCDYSRRYTLHPTSNWKEYIDNQIVNDLNNWKENESLVIALPSLKYEDIVDRIWLSTVELDATNGTFIAKQGIWNLMKRKASSFVKLLSGDHSQSWQKVALYAINVIHRKQITINGLLAEHGPNAGLYVANKTHRKYQIPWVVDARDPLLMGYPKFLKNIVFLWYKYYLIATAKALINVNPIWVASEGNSFGKNAYLITNGYEPEEFKYLVPQRTRLDESIVILYYGNIYPFQDIEGFLNELGEICKSESMFKKQIQFQYFGNAYESIRLLIKKYGLLNNFSGGYSISRKELFEKGKNADMLLLLSVAPYKKDIPKDFVEGFYPGKVFEYLGFEIPILCYPGDNGILSDFVNKTGSGYTISRGQLYDFIKQSKRLVSKLTFQTFQYTRKEQSIKLIKVLDEIF